VACLALASLPITDAATAASYSPENPIALTQSRWTSFPPGPLSARTQEAAVWTGSDFLIWGGQSVSGQTGCPCSTNMLGNGALFDPRTGKWTAIAKSPLTPRDGVASVWTGHVALMWGGQTEDTASNPVDSNGGAVFDPSTGRWSSIPTAPLLPRFDATGIWTGKEAIFIGGNSPPGATASSTSYGVDLDAAAYDPATRHWARLPDLPTKGLGSALSLTAVWTGHELITWSSFQTTTAVGDKGEQIRNRQLGAEWMPGRRSWKALLSPPDSIVTAGGTSSWLDRRDVVIGGSGCVGAMSCPAPITSTAEFFNPANNTWQLGPEAPIFIRPDLIVSTGTALVLINESTEISGPNLHFSPGDGTLFEPTKRTIPSLPAVPRDIIGPSSSLIWTGHSLLMWGVTGDSTRTFGLQLSEQ